MPFKPKTLSTLESAVGVICIKGDPSVVPEISKTDPPLEGLNIISPLLFILKGDESGFVESSTTKAFPVPTCVTLNISVDVLPLIRFIPVPPLTVILPTTFKELPSNVKFGSPLITPDVPVAVNTLLFVLFKIVATPLVPLVPDEPLVPLTPLVPDVPLIPEVPDVPLIPEVPDVPLVPEVPFLPDVPLVPLVPELPLVPLVPEVPELPLVPFNPFNPLNT